jgi:hypothetical protein
MKATILKKSGFVLLLALAPFFGGCNEQANSATVNDTVPSVANGQPPANSAMTDTNEMLATNDDALANAEGKLISTPDTASTNVSNNPQLTDFVKLVQAGVGESVLMAYVTNSQSAFNLSSDDIVYLNDLGAPETTITAMLQRDQYYNGSAATAPAPTTAQPAPPAGTAPPPMMEQSALPDQYASAQTPPLTPSADVEAEVQQSPNASYSYFYDSLAPYGNWVDISGYGPCWQPTVVAVNPGWQPYCDRGHWAYTDCGWCWVSDYSWGWAPFHYGRWFHHNRFGWCWAPDTVWGPSWVSWRYSDSYCGWAPLPPSACYRPGFGFTYYGRSVGFNFTFGLGINHFTFVPLNHFHDRYPGRYRVEHREVTKIYNTTIINNQIIRGNNNTIINRGVPVDRVARATHTDIRPIKIRADASAPRTAQLGRDGRSLSVFRPELPKPRTTGPATKFVGEGVQPAPHFDLHSRVEQARVARENPSRNPTVTAGPERRPIISNPAMSRPSEIPGRNNRDNRLSQPETERPGSLIMRGPNQNQNRPDRGTISRDGNAGQTPTPATRRGFEPIPQQPGQVDRGDNNRRTVTPPLRPQDSRVAPTFNRPDNNQPGQPRDDGNQARQQRQLLEQQQQQMRQQQQQQLQQQQRQQRDFQPVVPTPRQEPPARSFESPRGNNAPDFNPAPRYQPPVRSEPVAPPRTFESRPAPEIRSAPPQPSAPARESRPDNGGNQRGGGRDDNGGRNDRGNGRNR